MAARGGEDFSYVVLLDSLNAYVLFTESFVVLTLTTKLLYEFMVLPDFIVFLPKMNQPDFCQFDLKNEPIGFRWERMVKVRSVPTLNQLVDILCMI